MSKRTIVTLAAAIAAGGAVSLTRRYQANIATAQGRLNMLSRSTVRMPWGTCEYTETPADSVAGDELPVLVSHGIFHGCDGGLLAVEDLFPHRLVIVPSRFGYLATTMPATPSSAKQADAFAELLDHLDLDRVDVIGISAGTGAAVQLALRHPDRVGHLIISSGNLPGSPTAEAPPAWAKAFYTQPAMWALRVAAPTFMRRLMGVPAGFPHTEEQTREIDIMIDSIFPLTPRRAGAIFDAYQSNPEINDLALCDVVVPTLIIHSADDPLASYDAAAAAAKLIPHARLVTLDEGGHLQLGQDDVVRRAMAEFLSATSAEDTVPV